MADEGYCVMRFKYDVSNDVVRTLTKKFGFSYSGQTTGMFVEYRKRRAAKVVHESVSNMLARECNRICEKFYSHDGKVDKALVVAALHKYAAERVLPLEKQWVLDWTKRNIESSTDDSLPWN